jgi:hypothetical protein
VQSTELSLVSSIVQKGVLGFIEEAENAILLGFNVRLVITQDEKCGALFKVTENYLRTKKSCYSIVTLNDREYQDKICGFEKNRRTLLLASDYFENSTAGKGFVTLTLPSLVDLLPSISICIEKVLTHFGLNLYLSAFTAEHRVGLRRLLVNGSLDHFIDGVVQIAFLEGVRGEPFCVDSLNDGAIVRKKLASQNMPTGSQIALVLDWALESSEDPYLWMRALLSYYATEIRKMPQSEASKKLDLSRSTLQIHLKAAKDLKVGAFFETHSLPAISSQKC